MALDASVLVDLPEHGIAYKKVSGKTYVYYVTATYRNKNGNPTCDRSSIGRLDEMSGKLIPNRNYYEIFLKQPIPPAGIPYIREKINLFFKNKHFRGKNRRVFEFFRRIG